MTLANFSAASFAFLHFSPFGGWPGAGGPLTSEIVIGEADLLVVPMVHSDGTGTWRSAGQILVERSAGVCLSAESLGV